MGACGWWSEAEGAVEERLRQGRGHGEKVCIGIVGELTAEEIGMIG